MRWGQFFFIIILLWYSSTFHAFSEKLDGEMADVLTFGCTNVGFVFFRLSFSDNVVSAEKLDSFRPQIFSQLLDFSLIN